MARAARAARDARRRRALSLPVVGSAAAILMIVVAAVFLLASLGGEKPAGEKTSMASAQKLYEKGDYAAAEKALSKIVADDSGDMAARKALALALAAQGKNDDAIKQYRAVIKADPKDDASLFALAGLEQLTGDASGSIAHYEAAVALQADPEYLQALAAVYATVGRWSDSIKTWEQYLGGSELDAAQQARVYDAIASDYENAREYDNAKAALRQALSLDPNNQQYQARLKAYEG